MDAFANTFKTKMVKKEKRKYPRVRISFPVECSLLPQRNYFYTVSTDLSLGGTKIIDSKFLPRGSLLSMQLNFIDQLLKVKVRVAWCNRKRASERHYTGLEFLEMSELAKQNLSNFLKKIYPTHQGVLLDYLK